MDKLKTRVFFVDNNQRMVERWQRILNHHGYRAQTYYLPPKQKLDRCLQEIYLFRPHVVIADMRLEDDDRISDTSGLKLLHRVKARCPTLPFIIYSAFLDTNRFRLVINEGGTVVGKEEQPNNLLNELRQLSQKVSRVASKEYHIIWPTRWNEFEWLQYLLPISTADDRNHLGTYISDTLLQTFADKYHTVHLTPLEPNLRAEAMRSVRMPTIVAGVDLDNVHMAHVIRITNAQSIHDEQTHYEALLATRSNNMLLTELIDTHTFWDLGVSVYRLAKRRTHDLQSLWDYFCGAANSDESVGLVVDFHKKEWRSTQGTTEVVEESTFTRLVVKANSMADVFAAETAQLSTHLHNFEPDFRNWIEQISALHAKRHTTTLTHGSFHSDNLLTDGRYLWPINFEQSGMGPQYHDFCALECDFVLRAASALEDETTIYLLMAALTNLHLTEPPPLPDQLESQQLANKVIVFIEKLRQFAFNVEDSSQQIEYYGTLLEEVITFAQVVDPTSDMHKYACWFAAFICERCSTREPIQIELPPPPSSPTENGEHDMLPGDAGAKLRAELQNIVDDSETIRLIVRGAGLKAGNINLQGAARNSWYNILREAELQGKLNRLIEVVITEFPHQKESLQIALQNLIVALGDSYHEAVPESTSQPSTPPSQPAPTNGQIFTWHGPTTKDVLERRWSNRSRYRQANLLERMQQVVKATGRVEYAAGGSIGTGFMVGPDLLLTNHHVLPANTDLSRRRVRFGYRLNQDELEEHGTTYSFQEILAHSPSTELDFTLVRLTEAAGAKPTIGYVTLDDREIKEDDTLDIVQHSGGRPLEIAFSSDPVVYIAPEHRRVQYLTTTEGGSSGSPVCNQHGFVVAIHHSAEPHPSLPKELGDIRGNEGIPIKAILPEIQTFL